MIKYGAKVSANDNAALKIAAGKGHVTVVNELLRDGADATAENNRAIKLAMEKKHMEVVRALEAAGASLDLTINS